MGTLPHSKNGSPSYICQYTIAITGLSHGSSNLILFYNSKYSYEAQSFLSED